MSSSITLIIWISAAVLLLLVIGFGSFFAAVLQNISGRDADD